jgi:hypothetical protein
MNDKTETTRRLLRLARRGLEARRAEPDSGAGLEIPVGFPRRVAQVWVAEVNGRTPRWTPSWRPVLAAMALVVLSIGFNWQALDTAFTPRDLVTQSMRQSFYQP